MKVMALGGMALLHLAACADQQDVDMTGSSVEAIARHQNQRLPNNLPVPTPTGWATTTNTQGGIDLGNDYFQDLGTNGRRCVSCHLPTAGWGITPPQIQEIFNLT